MLVRGKLLGGIVGMILCDLMGLPLGGLVGFILGSTLGHFFIDLPLKAHNSQDGHDRDFQRRQGEFVYHVFRLCAKMAKSDGRVNQSEVALMERIMRQQFRLSDKGRDQAIRIWKMAKDSNEPFEHYARAFYRDFSRDRYQVMNMMDLLFAVAASDGSLHPREEELLLKAAGIFHVSRMQFERIKGRYYSPPPGKQQRWSVLDPYYAILGANPQETMEEVKKKFRNLAMQWHPDKLTAKGASPEAVRHAKEKFQQINEAYTRIVEARK
ncbi:MAG: TerB family tellurite resistance protein [Lewinellaceae bacterium]|nr:TerB family tellurite resistance protein [Lewinellaceae bacterium]